jgi:hypothetical protein
VTSPTEATKQATQQYADFVQQGQDATLKAVETWTRTVQDAFASAPAQTYSVNVQNAVDQAYDLAAKLLEVQRGFVKNLVANAVEAADTAKAWTPRIADDK